ncbi:Electron transport complex subunit RnfG [bioreactor metagenome]|uniref:Electron transport complex subunit RnfG n=1 Tax=bioreactor metagenome TaxID=1076179 RepID=A0A645HD87_9ZZZZ
MSTKKKNSLFNLTTTLLIIAGVAAFVLAEVYNVTLEPINQAKVQKKQTALKEVLPAFDNTTEVKLKSPDGTDSITMYIATQGTDTVGYAFETYTDKGFSGRFTFMVGFTPTGEIVNTKVLDQKETPGLGSKMTEDKFKNQFNGKNPETYKLAVKKDMGDVDAITASTISSRAYCDGLNRAYTLVKPYLKGGAK